MITGIQPAAFRLVAQYFNEICYRVKVVFSNTRNTVKENGGIRDTTRDYRAFRLCPSFDIQKTKPFGN
jgi:hypothetical protein